MSRLETVLPGGRTIARLNPTSHARYLALGVTERARTLLGARLVHEPLALGVAAMLVGAVAQPLGDAGHQPPLSDRPLSAKGEEHALSD